MELNELIMLSAAALLAPSMRKFHGVSAGDQYLAVKEAKSLWLEVLKQEKED